MLVLSLALTLQSAALPEAVWEIADLDAPENVIADGRGGYFISNVNGEAAEANGLGYIARFDGTEIDRGWSTGLNAPKGMALLGGRLWASDLTVLAEIDPDTGEVLARHEMLEAGFLNDVAVYGEGALLVTDSSLNRILHVDIATGEAEIWVEGQEIRGPNGMWVEADRVLLLAMSEGRFLAIDRESREITVLAENLRSGDGLWPLGGGDYLLSQWPGRLNIYRADGSVELIVDETEEPATYMNDFLIEDDLVIIPHWMPGSVTAHRLTDLKLE